MWESHPRRIRVMLVIMDSAMHEKTYTRTLMKERFTCHLLVIIYSASNSEVHVCLFLFCFVFLCQKLKFLFNAIDISSTATLLCTVLLLLSQRYIFTWRSNHICESSTMWSKQKADNLMHHSWIFAFMQMIHLTVEVLRSWLDSVQL